MNRAPPVGSLEGMKILVAYASKRGSTAEIAEAIAEILRESGLEVDCSPPGRSPSLDATTLSSSAAPST